MLDDPNRDPIEVLADQFMQLHREHRASDSQPPTIQQFASRYPEHAQDILDLFPMILDLERLKESDENSRPRPATAGAIGQKTLGDFQILSEIGRGGMGVVYLARQKSLGRSVALKVLSKSLSSSPQQVQRFHLEAEAAAGLHHTNIVPVYGVGNTDDFHYYAMQWIDGIGLDEVVLQLTEDPQLVPVDQRQSSSSIRKRFSDSGNLAHQSYFRNVARIGADIADALDYAHQHKVLHRDIKPSNILLDANDDAWITDFGLAKLGDDRALTQTGELIGTLRYMAPEQFDGHTDQRSDIYSLGLTLYELLTLQPAFNESQHAKLLTQRTRGSISAPRTLNPQVPRDLETIILTACATEPAHRYQHAAELQADLQRFLEGRPVLARRISTSERVWRWCRRNPAIAMSSASAAILLITVAAVSFVAYFQTHAALMQEQRAVIDAQVAQKETERSRQQAEETLNVAIEAFDSIFNNLTRRGVPQSLTFDYGEEDPPVLNSVLTADDAQLMEELLEFYQRFAQQNVSDERLQLKILSAQHRVGLIQFRLGKLEAAESTLLKTRSLATSIRSTAASPLEAARLEVQLLNDLGEIKYRQEQPRRGIGDGFRYHQQVIEMIGNLPQPQQIDPQVQFELARAYDLMGSTMFRSQLTAGILQYADERPDRGPKFGPPPGFREPDFLGPPDRNRDDDDRGPEPPDRPAWDQLAHWAADMMRPPLGPPLDAPPGPDPFGTNPNTMANSNEKENRPRDFGARPKFGLGPLPDIEKSIEILQPLVVAQPENPMFASLQAKALQHRYVYLLCQRADREKTTQAFLDAEKQIRNSIQQQPDNPQLVVDLADHLSTASTQGTTFSLDTVVAKIDSAVTEIQKLAAQFPSVTQYQALLASSHRNLARTFMLKQNWLLADQHLQTARQQLESLIPRSEDKYYKWSLVATILDQAQVILEQGKTGSEEGRRESFTAAIDQLLAASEVCQSIDEGRGPSTSQRLTTDVYLKLADLYEKTNQPEKAQQARRKTRKHSPLRRMLPFGF